MSKHKEYSKRFGIFYDNFRRWCREMAARGELSDHPEEQFHLSSLDIENKKSIVYTDEEINQTAHFAINLITYISCLPDCFTDGAPHGIKAENNHRLATSEKVVDAMESVGEVVNPHFRRGYFKRLESYFYKNKKGQIIFVQETVVNVQSKVLSSIKEKK